MDRWQSKQIVCKGGLDLSEDALTQGTMNLGTAKMLQNYEPSLEGGYGRILGYLPWDETPVPGEGSILGVKVALSGGVFAAREANVYKSYGSGWTKITTPDRASGADKYRFISYSMTTPQVLMCDGVDFAAKYDGTTYTLINGTGAPADPKYALQAISRVILAGYSSNPRAISISAPSTDDDFDAANGAVEIVVGDIIVGMRLFRSTIYIFCDNSLHKLTGSTTDDFAITPVTSSIGCISGDTIQEVGGDLLFMAPDGLRSLAATDRIGDVDLALQSRKIQPLIRNYISSFTSDRFSSVVVRKKSQYRTFIFDPATLDPTATYGGTGVATYGSSIYGLLSEDNQSPGVLGKLAEDGTYEWATTLGINAFCADSEYTEGEEVIVFGHPADGMVYRLEQGYSFNGRSVEYIYRTPQFTFDDASFRKVLQKATVYTEVQGDIDTTLAVRYDFEAPQVLQPPPVTLKQTTGNLATYGTAEYSTAVYSQSGSPVFRKNLIGSGFTAAFVFSGNDIKPTHRIDSFQIDYSVKGRR